jgi:hypothetical protein
MAGCAPIQFQDVTRARFNCLQQAASQQLTVILKGDSGSASDPGGTNTIYGDHFCTPWVLASTKHGCGRIERGFVATQSTR